VENVPPLLLTRSAERARAAAVIMNALHSTDTQAFTLVDTLDAASAAVLRTAGLDDNTIRVVLAALWEHPLSSADTGEDLGTLRVTDRDRELLRDLGQRLRTVRLARRLRASEVARTTHIPVGPLHDLEAGMAAPTVLALYRLADALRAPLPLLIDPLKSPTDVVVTLARAEGLFPPAPADSGEPDQPADPDQSTSPR
jgi:transcriptional regulator with XRE-family HTH domain